jgi:hypothetical protein
MAEPRNTKVARQNNRQKQADEDGSGE